MNWGLFYWRYITYLSRIKWASKNQRKRKRINKSGDNLDNREDSNSGVNQDNQDWINGEIRPDSNYGIRLKKEGSNNGDNQDSNSNNGDNQDSNNGDSQAVKVNQADGDKDSKANGTKVSLVSPGSKDQDGTKVNQVNGTNQDNSKVSGTRVNRDKAGIKVSPVSGTSKVSKDSGIKVNNSKVVASVVSTWVSTNISVRQISCKSAAIP